MLELKPRLATTAKPVDLLLTILVFAHFVYLTSYYIPVNHRPQRCSYNH